MKNLSFTLVLFFFCQLSIGQNVKPIIDSSSVLNYSINLTAMGENLNLRLSNFGNKAPFQLKWIIDGYGQGYFLLSEKSIESATKILVATPENDVVTKLKEDCIIGIISKNSFASLKTKKDFELCGKTFTPQNDTSLFKLKGSSVHCLFAQTPNGKSQVWILDDPDFPVILKLKGNPDGIDFLLKEITQ